MSALGNLPSPARADTPPADTIVLEDGHLSAVFDRQYGSLLTLENKQIGWRVQDRSQFGAGFRMHVPFLERRYTRTEGFHRPRADSGGISRCIAGDIANRYNISTDR
jgi:hypothetical protein